MKIPATFVPEVSCVLNRWDDRVAPFCYHLCADDFRGTSGRRGPVGARSAARTPGLTNVAGLVGDTSRESVQRMLVQASTSMTWNGYAGVFETDMQDVDDRVDGVAQYTDAHVTDPPRYPEQRR